VSNVILLSLSSPYPPPLTTREATRARLCLRLELQADLQGTVDLQADQEWPFLFVAPSPEIVGKYRKSGPLMELKRNARKKRQRLFQYIVGDTKTYRVRPAEKFTGSVERNAISISLNFFITIIVIKT